jgi:hypothetical protein
MVACNETASARFRSEFIIPVFTSGVYIMKQQYESLIKIGAVTFCGAFFGAFTVGSTLPTTFIEWKAILLPALGAGIAAEIVYLRSVFAVTGK